MSTTKIENASTVLFEVNVFSNKAFAAKLEARDIAKTADEGFSEIGFTRIMMNPTPNLQDNTIFRITARYEGVVAPEKTESGTTYRIYRN